MKHTVNKLITILFASVLSLTGCDLLSPTNEQSKDVDKEIVYHTISYDSNGGSQVESVQVKHGDRIPIPKEQPTKAKNDFVDWKIFNGKVGMDSTFEYKDGEETLEENYLTEDDGYFTALSDITLKATWDNSRYGINAIFNDTGFVYNSSDNILIEQWRSALDAVGVPGLFDWLTDRTDYDVLFNYKLNIDTNNSYDIVVLSIYVADNEADIEKLNSYYPNVIFDHINYIGEIPAAEQNWIKNHFDTSITSYVEQNNQVYGYPIKKWNTLLRNKDTLEYNIPATAYTYGFLNKNRFLEDSEFNSDMRSISLEFLKTFSMKNNNINS